MDVQRRGRGPSASDPIGDQSVDRGASRPSEASVTKKRTHGGKRPGAGRPRSKLPEAVIEKLGPPPLDAASLRTWNARLLAEVQWLSIRGEIATDLAASLRANAGAIERALPPAPRAAPLEDAEDEDDDGETGPELEEDPSDGDGLRVG